MRDYWLSKLFFDLQSPALAAEFRADREKVLARYELQPAVKEAIARVDVPFLANRRRLVEDILSVLQVQNGISSRRPRFVPRRQIYEDGPLMRQKAGAKTLVRAEFAGERVLFGVGSHG